MRRDGSLHNDHFLSAEDKASGRKIMPCVSRFEGHDPRAGAMTRRGATMTMTAIEFRDETFRDDFTFRNSPAGIRALPVPVPRGQLHVRGQHRAAHARAASGSAYEHPIDVDEHYVAEMRDRALVLAEDPLRCQSLPHMTLRRLGPARAAHGVPGQVYPEHFALERDGDRWHWINRPLGIDDTFTFGDASTLPYGPMEYITRQSQGDFCIVDQRDGNLWMDAGMVTTQADWSLDFDVGMNFMEWHGPVPLAHEIGVFDRALKFLLNLQPGPAGPPPQLDDDHQSASRHEPRALSALGHGPRDRHARERRREGAPARRAAELLAAAALQRDRVPDPLLSDQHGRARHDPQVGRGGSTGSSQTLPPELADYKGLTRYRQTTVDWLAGYDDGAPTSPGFFPDP